MRQHFGPGVLLASTIVGLVISFSMLVEHTEGTGGNIVAVPYRESQVGDTSISLDALGNPVISFVDVESWSLKVLHCGNGTCSSDNTVATPALNVLSNGRNPLALDAAGNPVISYVELADGTNGPLKVLHCGNATCTTGNVVAAADPEIARAGEPSLALDAEGKPVIAFVELGELGLDDYALKVVRCGNATCTANNVSTTIESGPVLRPSLALDASGNPVIAYSTISPGASGVILPPSPPPLDLKIVRCGNPSCSSHNTITVVDSGVSFPLLSLDEAGRPVIAYSSDSGLKLLRCGNADCTSGNSIVSLATNLRGANLALALDHDIPVVVYDTFSSELFGSDLLVLRCGDATCSSGNTIATVDTAGASSSLVLDDSGKPSISYSWQEGQTPVLKVLRCGDPACGGALAKATPSNTPVFGDTATPTEPATRTPTPTRTPTRTPTPTSVSPRGDVTCDGIANSVDALFILQYQAGLIPSLPCLGAADVNRDGTIGPLDALLILQYGAGLIPALA